MPFFVTSRAPKVHRASGSGRGKPACFHESFQDFIFPTRVVLKPLDSLIGRLVACSARKGVDTQTDRRTDKVTLAAHARRGVIKSCHRMTGY